MKATKINQVFTSVRPVRFTPLKGDHLQLSGVGFKMFTTLERSLIQVGYSHYILKRRLEGDLVRAKRQNLVVHSGDFGRSNLSQQFQTMKRPDPYKARGIHLVNVALIRKQGKRR